MDTNSILQALFEIIGDKIPGGYALPVDGKLVPIHMNKDFKAEYPEIRVAPFTRKKDAYYDKYTEPQYQQYKYWQSGSSQIDIYDTNVVSCQKIYDVLIHRIYDFFNLETLIYNYSPFEFDGEIYKTKAYALLEDQLFKDIYGIRIGDIKLKRSLTLEDIPQNGFYVDNEFLYVKTDQDIEDIEIKVLLQGRLFRNGESVSDRGIHTYSLSKQRNLTHLESNQVERISFDMNILYNQKRYREKLPDVHKINVNRLTK